MRSKGNCPSSCNPVDVDLANFMALLVEFLNKNCRPGHWGLPFSGRTDTQDTFDEELYFDVEFLWCLLHSWREPRHCLGILFDGVESSGVDKILLRCTVPWIFSCMIMIYRRLVMLTIPNPSTEQQLLCTPAGVVEASLVHVLELVSMIPAGWSCWLEIVGDFRTTSCRVIPPTETRLQKGYQRS